MRFSHQLKLLVLLITMVREHRCRTSTFTASFQSKINESFDVESDVWIEFPNKISNLIEFTVCHWVNIRLFNVDASACLWTYCTKAKKSDDIKCLQLCLYGIYNTLNRNLRIVGSIDFSSIEVSKNLESYKHRTWTHICWKFSITTGESEFYENGISLGKERVNVSNYDWIIGSLDEVDETAFIFGQEPDELRGGYEKFEAFIGSLSELSLNVCLIKLM